MPRRDGTGPISAGAMTGRGLGRYAQDFARYSAGFGRGRGSNISRGFGRCFAVNDSPRAKKSLLLEEKEILQHRLDVINQQLDEL